MAVVEDIELRITVDGTSAKKGLDETRKAAEDMGGATTKAIDWFGGLRKGAQDLQSKLGPTAAAISGVSSALGQTGGEAAKVVAGVGQMAAAFGAGGPWAVALVGATMLVDEYSKVQQEAASYADAWRDNLARTAQAMRDGVIKTTTDLTTALAKAQEEIRNFGKTSREIEEATYRANIASLEKRAATLTKNLPGLQQVAKDAAREVKNIETITSRLIFGGDSEVLANARQNAIEREETAKTAAANLRTYNAELDTQRQALADLIKANDELERKRGRAAGGGGGARGPSGPTFAEQQIAMMAEEEQQLRGVRQASLDRQREGEQAASAARAAQIQADLDMEEQAINWLADLRKRASDEYLAQKKAESEALKADAMAVTGFLVGVTQDYVDARIRGEEDAEAAMAAAIMRQAGQALISYGTQAVGQGVLLATNPVTAALAPASFAAGAGLIAGGIALGGAATGVMHAAAGGTIGRPIASANSTTDGGGDMAARARPARATPGGSGGTHLTIVYGGLSGPSADDGARALRAGLDRARRRGMA